MSDEDLDQLLAGKAMGRHPAIVTACLTIVDVACGTVLLGQAHSHGVNVWMSPNVPLWSNITARFTRLNMSHIVLWHMP